MTYNFNDFIKDRYDVTVILRLPRRSSNLHNQPQIIYDEILMVAWPSICCGGCSIKIIQEFVYGTVTFTLRVWRAMLYPELLQEIGDLQIRNYMVTAACTVSEDNP